MLAPQCKIEGKNHFFQSGNASTNAAEDALSLLGNPGTLTAATILSLDVGGPADPIAPTIIIPPRNTSVVAGTSEVTMECVANARWVPAARGLARAKLGKEGEATAGALHRSDPCSTPGR